MPSDSVCDDRVSARAGQVRFTDERPCATGAPPQFAEGLIVGRSGAATGVPAVREEPKLSHYTVTGAELGWTDSRGKVRRLPISALKFDSAQGITIELNGLYRALALTSYRGRYDSVTQEGRLAPQATRPETFEAFADMSFQVNGHPVDVPLLDLPDFHQALDSKGALVYERDGLHLEVDFGKETWAGRSAGNRPFPEPRCPVRPPEIGP